MPPKSFQAKKGLQGSGRSEGNPGQDNPGYLQAGDEFSGGENEDTWIPSISRAKGESGRGHENTQPPNADVMETLWKLQPVIVLVVLVLLGIPIYTLYASNGNLTTRIEELERKILIDKDIEKLIETITSLEKRNIDLASKLEKLDKLAVRLDPKVKELDETFGKLKPTADKCDKTVTVLGPKIEQMEKTVVEMKPKVEECDNTVRKLDPKVEQLVETVNKVKPKFEKLEKDVGILEPKVTELDEIVMRSEPKVEKFGKVIPDLEPKVKKLQETVHDKLEPTVAKLDEKVPKLKPEVEKLEKDVGKLKPDVEKLEETFTDLDRRVKKLDGKVSGTETLTDDVKTLKSTTDEIHERLYNLGEYSWKKVPESQNRIDSLELSSRSTNAILYLIMVVVFGLVTWEVYTLTSSVGVQKRAVQHSSGTHRSQTPADDQETYRPVRSVLDSIHPSTLNNQICVISFYSETKALHMRLVESACISRELRNVERVSSLISVHDNIPNLPRAKVFLVFVDFNERDIILEHPDREVGDLRMTTVQGARKMGGDVFVVYVKDKGSQNLNQQELYNEHLRSINIHPELSVLSAKQRVLTTFDEFTMFQRSHLAKIL
ncbi:uncharacterized protein LOC117340883 isoform X2 [Pecten maximus]|uniref:uncharacterized protein LOC117340883 isoform X2 n=1 Tax=Pecten maximus TaxID=6579 RepID=UPI0014583474|nr:uncharacterized protein LOC117340883 isoform X2 [Pecten maximus]